MCCRVYVCFQISVWIMGWLPLCPWKGGLMTDPLPGPSQGIKGLPALFPPLSWQLALGGVTVGLICFCAL